MIRPLRGPRVSCRTLLGAVALVAIGAGGAAAQRRHQELPIRPARTIVFETTEGTRMNMDLSPDGRTIVFDLLGDIYTVPVGGGGATQLTRGLSFDTRPVWSPDGTHIAYLSDATGTENLWVMAADGTGPRAVTNGHTLRYHFYAGLEWMPDGRHLVSGDTLYHLGGGKRKLPGVPPARRGPPRFSPDGRYAYFDTYRAPDGVRRYDRATGESIQLANPPVPFCRPVVSPDGRWLAYITTPIRPDDSRNGLRIRDLETGEDRWLAHPVDQDRTSYERYVFTGDSKALLIGFGGKLHRIDVATGRDRIIPFTAKVRVELGPFIYHRFRVANDSLTARYIRSPAVSPDGTTLVFSALQRLYAMALPHGAPRRLLPHAEDGQFHPAYSPDGRWIAYVTWSDADGGHVWRVPAGGGRPERLTPTAGYYQWPTWSPDGKTIAVLTAGALDARVTRATRGALQLLPSTGGTPRTILEMVSRESPAVFTPDGHRILVVVDGDAGIEQRGDTLVSIQLDGRGRRVVAHVAARPGGTRPGPQIVPSPDGRYVAYQIRDDLYLTPTLGALDSVPLNEWTGAAPTARLTRYGALDPRWEHGGKMLTWVFGNQVYHVDPDRAMAAAARATHGGEAPGPGDRPADGRDGTATGSVIIPDEAITIRLTVPRATARGTLALRGARVITMRGREVLENATIVIRDDRIAAVGPSARVAIPRRAEVLDVRGKTIMPGLVDLHAHLHEPRDVFFQRHWAYLANLIFGVTTARDPSGSTDQFGYAELIEAGRMLGPRLFSAGNPVTSWEAEITSLDDARAVVRRRQTMGAVLVKQYLLRTRRERQWLFQAAAEAGLNVTNEHGDDPADLTLLLDGATGVEHSPRLGFYGDVARLMAEAKTWYTPTLQVWHAAPALVYYRERNRRLHDDPRYRRLAPYDEVLDHRRSGELWRPGDSRYLGFVGAARGAADIAHQGGHVTLGSHGEDQGAGVHWELWALQSGGLTNHEALQAATLDGAKGLGMDRDLGSLEVGKIADLLILEKNPLENIEHTLTIRYTMKNGVLYDGSTLDTVWPRAQRWRGDAPRAAITR